MNKKRWLITIHLVLLVVLVAIAVDGYLSLPDRYPVHFNLRGEADRWAERGGLAYWLLPPVPIVLGLGLLWLLKIPHHYNYPQKEQVNSWPKDKRQPVYLKLQEMMLSIAIGVDLVFIYAQFMAIESATGASFSPWGMFVPILLIPAVVVGYLVGISRLVDRIATELKTSGWTPQT